MTRDPAAATDGLPLALLLATHDSLRRVGRMARDPGDPPGPAISAENRIAQAAIEAVLRGVGRRPDPAEPPARDRADILLRAARALEVLGHRLADLGVRNS